MSEKRSICKIPQAWIDKRLAARPMRRDEQREGFAGSALLVEALLKSRVPQVETTESLLHKALTGLGIDAKVAVLKKMKDITKFSVGYNVGLEARDVLIVLNDKILDHDNPLRTVHEIITAMGISPNPKEERRLFYIVPGLDKRV
ncbi:MAG: hypothetical protein V1827_05430 [Candidatus Micrarchaeota archaeon]